MQNEGEVPQSWQVLKENKGNLLMSLYGNINKKRKRIAAGSGEKMRSVGDKGAPTAANFRKAAATAKPKTKKTGRA
jgi:hypothetical protein